MTALAGCSSGKTSPPSTSSESKGQNGVHYYVNLSSPPVGGIVTSSETPTPKINCGVSSLGTPVPDANGVLQYARVFYSGANVCGDARGQTQFQWSETVVLTAVARDGNAFIGWAGDCSGGNPTCTLTAGPDRSVTAIFTSPGNGHTTFTDPALHGPAYAAFLSSAVGALQCTKCHGANLQGQSIAPSCAACHAWPRVTAADIVVFPAALSFTASVGSVESSSRTLTVSAPSNCGAPDATPVVSTKSSWLTVSASGRASPYVVSVNALGSELPAGTYDGSISIACAGPTGVERTVAVALTVVEDCSLGLPLPEVTYTGTYDYNNYAGSPYTSYGLAVTNAYAYPDSLFQLTSEFGPCGLNATPSRSWASVFDDSGTYIYGFCALGLSQSLTSISVREPRGVAPPAAVYVVIDDHKCGTQYVSRPVLIAGTTYAIGGTISGLTGGGVTLAMGSGPAVLAKRGDTTFEFAKRLTSGQPYAVTVTRQPVNPSQTCTVEHAIGTVTNAGVSDISVTCKTDENRFLVGGTITGLIGSGLILATAGEPNLSIGWAAKKFFFSDTLVSGSAYSVTVVQQPAGQTCTVANESGLVGNADVTTVAVTCTSDGSSGGSSPLSHRSRPHPQPSTLVRVRPSPGP